MGADRDRFSTATRLRALGAQAAERVYRAQGRKVRTPRKGRLTGRAALLALVLCSLVVALAYPTRQYVTQRSEIADQRRQAEQARGEVRELREQRARWRDPAYVERRHAASALRTARRDRLHHAGRRGEAAAPREHGPADRPWYEQPVGRRGQRGPAEPGADVTQPGAPAPVPCAEPKRRAAAHPWTPHRPGPSRLRPPTRTSRPSRSSSAARRAACAPSRTAARAGLPDVVETAPAAAGRHAVPDHVLPDLPARRRPRSARWRPTA